MSAVAYRVWHRLRSEWRSTLAFALVVGLVGAAVLALAAGARRTATAPDRWTVAHANGVDASLTQEAGLPRTTDVVALDAVDQVSSMTFLMAGLVPASTGEPADSLLFAGSAAASGATLIEGREPDPARPQDFAATTSFVDAVGAALGDHFQFVSLSQEQADRFGFALNEAPLGPTFEATLVGVLAGNADGDPSQPVESLAVFPLTVLDGRDIPVRSSVMAVSLSEDADLTVLRTELDSLGVTELFDVQPVQLVSGSVRTAVRAQATGLWLLAVAAAVTSTAALGQLGSRRARLGDGERASLIALGATKGQLAAESLARVSLPAVAGGSVAVGGAAAISGWFPQGFSGSIEPHAGTRMDALVLLPGAATFVLAVTIWVWVALVLSDFRPARTSTGSSMPSRVAGVAPTAASATGLRFAFSRQRSNSSSAQAALVGVLATAGVIIAAVTVGASLDRLVDDPARSGYTFDAIFGDAGATEPSQELQRALQDDPDVAGLMLLGSGQARIGEATLPLVGFESVRGPDVLRVLGGRLPVSGDEIALGRLTANDLGVGIGDQLTLEGASSTRTFHITGLVVMPSVGGHDGVGKDGLVTLAALQQLDSTAQSVGIGINLRPGVPEQALQTVADRLGLEAAPPDTPDTIHNLARVRVVPYLLAGLFAALGGLSVSHALFASVRSRRHDIAVLRALGADRPWISRVVRWQATTFTLVPTIIGVPVGLIIGRQVFRWLADSLGVVNDASIPDVLICTAVAGLLLLANVAAAVSARQTGKMTLAHLLHTA